MFGALTKYFEKRSLNGFMDRLVPAMRKRYGASPPYTEAQVRVAITELGLSEKFLEFALAVLCKNEDENPFHTKELVKLRSYRRVGSEGSACGACGGSWGGGGGSCGGGGGD